MATFLLVHGSWAGAWCWRELTSRLLGLGHFVSAIDLPGHGNDSRAPDAVTMADYVEAVLASTKSLPSPPILAGHSLGGVIASQVAEACPENIRALVCLASIQPPPGASMMQAVASFDPAYLESLIWAPDEKTAGITGTGVRRFLCNRCSDALAAEILLRIGPEPVAPFSTPILITAERYGRVPRFDVFGSDDRLIPSEVQARIVRGSPPGRVWTIEADHMSFFSNPAALASRLDQAAKHS
jgi:pimeloyl-ACP methyl ester carboxylesterase